jgi:hypothetical protein
MQLASLRLGDEADAQEGGARNIVVAAPDAAEARPTTLARIRP